METADQIMGLSPDLLTRAYGGAEQAYSDIFGEPAAMSAQDLARLGQLSAEAKRLAEPTPAARGIQSGIPGNPYSLSLTGLSQGLSQLATGLIDQDRRRQLFGDQRRGSRLEGRAQDRFNRAKQLRDQAAELRAGDRSAAAYLGFDPGFDFEAQAAELEAQADELERRAARDLTGAEDSQGIYGELQALTRRQEQATAEEEARRKFIERFGEKAYDAALDAHKEEGRQQALTERAKYREDQATSRARINAQARVNAARIRSAGGSGGPKIPAQYSPEYVQEFVKFPVRELNNHLSQVQKELKEELDKPEDFEILASFTATGQDASTVRDPSKVNQLRAEVARISNKRQLYEDVKNLSVLWEEMGQGEQPSLHYPSESEKDKLQQMQLLDMPQEMIEAYLFYSGIDFSIAPQPITENPTNSAARFFSE